MADSTHVTPAQFPLPEEEDPSRRDVIMIAAGGFAAVGLGRGLWPLLDMMNPDASARPKLLSQSKSLFGQSAHPRGDPRNALTKRERDNARWRSGRPPLALGEDERRRSGGVYWHPYKGSASPQSGKAGKLHKSFAIGQFEH